MTHGDYHGCDAREYTPAYIWYILGFLLVLLLLVSIFLVHVLIKTKFLHVYINRYKNKSTSTPEKLEAANASSQTWERKSVKRLHLDINKTEVDNEDENNQTLKRQDSSATITSNFNTLRAPKRSEGSGDVSPKAMKAIIKDMPIIKPEQMSEICKEVLKRRNVAEDTASSLQNIDQLVKEGTPDVKVEIKYASTPVLDIYDVLPTTHRNVKIENESKDTSKKPSITKSLNDNPEANCDIYDFPKESNSKALEVCDIYDSPTSDKMSILQSGYIVPYFSSTNLSAAFKQAVDKPAYALFTEISSEQSAKNSQSGVKPANNITEEEYDNPKKLRDENQIYINANENLFTDSSIVSEKSATNR